MSRVVWRRLLAAVAALLTAWLVVPAAVPIYDGLGNPDEPYRYVHPPAGAKPTKPPTVARATIKVGPDGLSENGYSNSAEIGPQVVYYVPQGALKPPAGTTTITITETPLAPSAPLPADGTIVGNVYRITATTAKGPAVVVGRGVSLTPTLDLRAPSVQQPGPVFEHRSGTGWVRSSTLRIGQDIYQTSASVLGDWALVRPAHSATSGGGSGGGPNVALLAAGIAVLVLVVIVVLIRARRTRGST